MQIIAAGSFVRSRKLGTALATTALAMGNLWECFEMRVCKSIAITLAAGMVFLLGASAQATVVFDGDDATKAIGIENLEIADFGFFDVEFTGLQSAAATYGLFPGDLDFNFDEGAIPAVDAITAAFNAVGGVLGVGDDGLTNPSPIFLIGFEVEAVIGGNDRITVYPGTATGDSWSREGVESLFYNNADRVWATFTQVPEPGSALLGLAALSTLAVLARTRRSRS